MKAIDNTYAVSTHVPMIKVVLENFHPYYILELGIGMHSTPLFLNHQCRKLFVESDRDWIEHMSGALPLENVILHEVTDEYNASNLPQRVEVEIKKYYESLKPRITSELLYPSLMFVDNFIACRNIAINTLYPLFDIIIYHDGDPAWRKMIGYKFCKGITNSFNSYMLETKSRWTGLLINKNYRTGESQLRSLIEPFVETYCNENKIVNNWELHDTK